MNTIHALGKFALEFDVFWCKFCVHVFCVHFLHLAKVLVVLFIIIVAIIGDVSIALLSSLASSRGFGGLITESGEANGAASLERSEAGKV
jgi:hypothetical protein